MQEDEPNNRAGQKVHDYISVCSNATSAVKGLTVLLLRQRIFKLSIAESLRDFE